MRYLRLVACAAIMLLISGVANAQQDFINNFAGGGPNNVPALSANLNYPTSTATDNAGNYYIIDPSQERVFKVDSSGTLTVVAGDGFTGYGGDGGPATQAELYLAAESQVAVDSTGNVYIADTYNYIIRVVSAGTGIISTFAGTPGTCCFGGDGGPATSAYLYQPRGLAVDASGNVYIGDTYNYRIRQVNTSGTINTVAGNGTFCAGNSNAPCGDGGPATSAYLGYIYSLAVDSAGNVFTSDFYYYNQVVRLFSVGGNINTVAGAYNTLSCNQNGGNPCGDGGPATSAGFNTWSANMSIASDPSGNLFIADFYNFDVREVVCADSAVLSCNPGLLTTGNIYTVAGTGGTYGNSGDTGPSTSATLGYAYGISVDSSDNMFIPNYYYLVVREAALGGNINTVAGNGSLSFTGNNIPATDAVLNGPWGVAFDASGNAYIADRGNCIVRKVDTSGTITLFAGTVGVCNFGGDGGSATAPGAYLNSPDAVATDAAGNVYIADAYNYRIRKVDPSGNLSTFAGGAGYGFSGDTGPATSAAMTYPYAVAADAAGNVYIADTNNSRIRKVDTTGTINTIAGNGNYCYYYYYGNCGDGGPATNALLTYPQGVAVDKAGNVYVSDTNDLRIRRINTAGIIDTFAGNGAGGFEGDGGPADQTSLYYPEHVAVDPAGDVIIADTSNQRIRLVDGQGFIHTVAGNGVYGYSGPEQNVLATTAELASPIGVGVDSSGNIYIGDTNNNLVRVVSAMANINASAYAVTFDLQPVGKISNAQQVTLAATGPISIGSITASTNFLESDNCAGITSGQTCVLNIYFKPPHSGTFTGTVTVASNSFFGSPLVINLTGKGTAILVSPTALVFKATQIGVTSAPKNVRVTNKGTTLLTFGAVTASGDFHLVVAATTPCGSTLGVGLSCNFAVNFKPTFKGLRTGSLTINDSDGSSPQFVSLSGTGAGNGASVAPTKLTFASQPQNSTKSKPVILTYNGTGTLTINSVTIAVVTGNNDFTVVAFASGATPACTSTLASGQKCAYKVSFTPTLMGIETSTLTINDTSPAGIDAQSVALTGTGQ